MRFFVLSSPRLNKKSIQTSESDELRVESYQERKKSNSNSNPKQEAAGQVMQELLSNQTK
jgi:hypothetical protein